MKIAIDDKCQEVFKQLKFEKKHRYIVYKIEAEKIILERTGQREQTWEHFLHSLPKDEYRFAVYDLEFTTSDGINSTKIFFFNWLPEIAKMKTKILYASGKEAFKTYLDINTKQINAGTVDEFTQEALIKEFNK